MPRTAAKVAVPGESAFALTEDPSAFVSDPDAAVEAGRAGRARKILKPVAAVAPAALTVPDDTRASNAPINAKAAMSVDEAKALDRKARLERPVMTPEGWYCPQNTRKQQMERKKAGADLIVDID